VWFWNREGLPARSYDGRFVTLPCYNTNEGEKYLLGPTFGDDADLAAGIPKGNAVNGYHHKVLMSIDFSGAVNTITRASGAHFFYGPLLPDEPTYVTSSITTGAGYPSNTYYYGGAGDNGEGTMRITGNTWTATKGGNRIANTPGYWDYGQLLMYPMDGKLPNATAQGSPPALFVTSPSELNPGANDAQHQYLRGLNGW